MKKYTSLMLLLLAALLFAGCGETEPSQSGTASYELAYTGMTAICQEDAAALLESNMPLTLLDVGTFAEYEEGHIKGAICVPLADLAENARYYIPLQNTQVLAYARTPEESASAQQILAELDYVNVADLGSFADWQGATETGAWGNPSEKTNELNSFYTFDIFGNYVDEHIFEDYCLTLVNVWGTSCGPCISEMPDLGELSREYASQGLQVLGVVTDVNFESMSEAKTLAEKTGATYRHLLATDSLYYAALQDVYGTPTTFFVDAEGNLVGEAVVGAMEKDKWIKLIEERLAMVKE